MNPLLRTPLVALSLTIAGFCANANPDQNINLIVDDAKTLSNAFLQTAGRELFKLCQTADANEINPHYNKQSPSFDSQDNGWMQLYYESQKGYFFQYGKNAILEIYETFTLEGNRSNCSLIVNVEGYDLENFITLANGYNQPTNKYDADLLHDATLKACRDSYIGQILAPRTYLEAESGTLRITAHAYDNPDQINNFICVLNVKEKDKETFANLPKRNIAFIYS